MKFSRAAVHSTDYFLLSGNVDIIQIFCLVLEKKEKLKKKTKEKILTKKVKNLLGELARVRGTRLIFHRSNGYVRLQDSLLFVLVPFFFQFLYLFPGTSCILIAASLLLALISIHISFFSILPFTFFFFLFFFLFTRFVDALLNAAPLEYYI